MKAIARVAVLMGSDSDLPVMEKAEEVLRSFEVGCLSAVASAHRTPQYLRSLIARAERKGVRVFIAGAGGAAHLAGVVASETLLPVIGVPLGSKLSGLDSLLSTVQMPRGIPVATVAIDNAANAALLAVQILSLSDKALAARYEKYRRDLTRSVIAKAKARRSR
ncbi:MAG: 5-(carboxyamino)imidazole ribonucleotide mutase [Elusimicrobia bacterium]|nr:5-(carboxyamino)imidazole ribonucleotide mutase [Elusimicrobiota bacterium]